MQFVLQFVIINVPWVILRNVFGGRDGAVDVAWLVEAGGQVLVGGEDGGPAVEADHGRQQVDHGGHAPVHQLDVVESHHHHDTNCPGQDDVHHAQDQERDHQTPDLRWESDLLMIYIVIV